MKENAIWMIVGLMGTALLGIILLQAYWIHGAIKLKEDQFDASVRDALSQVAIALKEKEDTELYTKPLASNGLTMTTSATAILKADSLMLSRGIEVSGLQNGSLLGDGNRSKFLEFYNSYTARRPRAIENRIDRQFLRDYLERELKNRGITIGYEYGIYSNKDKYFIIKNGNYNITDFSTDEVTEMPQEEIPEEDTPLMRSDYEVDLFTNEIKSPGRLTVYFPNKSSVLWGGNVWRTLLASFLSSAIVLLCFGYTIYVIFTQKKLSEMKTDFINNMTHEFKTPIATISLAADSITNPSILSNEEKIKRFASIIKQENKRMNNQVEKVLQMASLDKKNSKLKITSVHLHEVIEQAATNARLKVKKKEGAVRTDLQATDAIIEADLTHISNIINNLLDNANKYSPEKPKISVHTRNVKGGVEVIVRDEGIGMSKEARKHIFDKFYRVHTGNLHDVKGFGLGLSYVKAMITAHKGQIKVKSELGKGSSFILTFPKKYNENA